MGPHQVTDVAQRLSGTLVGGHEVPGGRWLPRLSGACHCWLWWHRRLREQRGHGGAIRGPPALPVPRPPHLLRGEAAHRRLRGALLQGLPRREAGRPDRRGDHGREAWHQPAGRAAFRQRRALRGPAHSMVCSARRCLWHCSVRQPRGLHFRGRGLHLPAGLGGGRRRGRFRQLACREAGARRAACLQLQLARRCLGPVPTPYLCPSQRWGAGALCRLQWDRRWGVRVEPLRGAPPVPR